MQSRAVSHKSDARSQIVIKYHKETKHAPGNYARSLGNFFIFTLLFCWHDILILGHLDWESQPNPFRFFDGSEKISLLPHLNVNRTYPTFYALDSAHTLMQPINASSISDFFFHSMALSAWKQHGVSKWSLRVNPSSGNLHPTEAYAILPGIAAGMNLLIHIHY